MLCKSAEKTNVNTVYAWSEVARRETSHPLILEWQCAVCTALWRLYLVAPQQVQQQEQADPPAAREIAIHFGDQDAWTQPGPCSSCQVVWTPM